MYPIFGVDFQWFLIIIIAVVGMIVQARLQSVFTKYSKVRFPNGMTGREVAEKMLRDNGITDVQVTSTPGRLTDNFNPRNKTVNLSDGVYNSASIAAAAVAAHECGHAIQHATGYKPLELRSALVPIITVSSTWYIWVLLAGVLLIETFPALFWIGILMFAMTTVFSLITLPVELNASQRALVWLQRSGGGLSPQEMSDARTCLKWAALTYVVAALASIATLLYYLSAARRR